MKRIILFRFHKNIRVCKNHIELLQKYNPDVPIYGLYGGKEKDFAHVKKRLDPYLKHTYCVRGKTSQWKWKNGDLALLQWYQAYGRKLDFDNDGDLDLVDANSGGDPNQGTACSAAWTNNGVGIFTYEPSRIPCNIFDSGDLNDFGLDVGKADSDADPDIATAVGGVSLPDRLLINRLLFTGIFDDESTRIPQVNEYSNDVLFVDVDNDVDKDLFVSTGLGLKNRLYINDGTGIYSDQSFRLPNNPYTSYNPAAADLDGDGDKDIIVGSANGQPDEYLKNDGTGTFTNAILPSDTEPTNDVELVDIDNDGDLDAVLADNGNDHLLINNGLGSFTDQTATRLPTYLENSEDYTTGDLDNDGDKDLILVIHPPSSAPTTTQKIRTFLNNGLGVFTETTNTMLVPSNLPSDTNGARAVTLGDVDNDGDQDLYIGIADLDKPNRQNRIYINRCA